MTKRNQRNKAANRRNARPNRRDPQSSKSRPTTQTKSRVRQILASAASAVIFIALSVVLGLTNIVESKQLSAWMVILGTGVIAALLWWGFGPRKLTGTVAGVLGLAVAISGALFWVIEVKEEKEFLDCKDGNTREAAFTAVTRADAVWARSQADQESMDGAFRIPGECEVGFAGYCLGAPIVDPTTSMPDARWFILSANPKRVVASAVVDGNPPDGMAPDRCKGGQQPPARDSIAILEPTQANLDGQVNVSMKGQPLLAIGVVVGWETPSGVQWKRIGIIGDPAKPHNVALDTRTLPRGAITLAAVTCLAALQPSDAVAVRGYRIGPGPAPDPYPAGADARKEACLLP